MCIRDRDTIQAIDYYRDNPLVQKAVKELAAAMPEMEVLGADANQQEMCIRDRETGAYLVREGYRSHKLKPYRKAL